MEEKKKKSMTLVRPVTQNGWGRREHLGPSGHTSAQAGTCRAECPGPHPCSFQRSPWKQTAYITSLVFIRKSLCEQKNMEVAHFYDCPSLKKPHLYWEYASTTLLNQKPQKPFDPCFLQQADYTCDIEETHKSDRQVVEHCTQRL